MTSDAVLLSHLQSRLLNDDGMMIFALRGDPDDGPEDERLSRRNRRCAFPIADGLTATLTPRSFEIGFFTSARARLLILVEAHGLTE